MKLHVGSLCFLLVVGFSAVHCAPYGLYGIPFNTVQLVSVDPQTAAETPIGPGFPNDYDAQGLSAIDDQNEILYLVVSDIDTDTVYLLGVSLNDGSLKTNIKLPFTVGMFVGLGQTVSVDTNTGNVYVSGRDPSVNNNHRIYKIVPSTGDITPVAEIGETDALGGTGVFDPKHQILWITLSTNTTIDLYGFDVVNGSLLYSDINTANMQTLNYDPVTGLIWGIGFNIINETYAQMTLATLNSANGKFNVVGVIDNNEYYTMDGSASAIDFTNRIIYVFLQPRGASNTPFQLAGVSMSTANIVSNPEGCTNAETCAWNLTYHNKPM